MLYLDPGRSAEANVKCKFCVFFDHVKGKIALKIALKRRVKTWEQYSKILETIPQYSTIQECYHTGLWAVEPKSSSNVN